MTFTGGQPSAFDVVFKILQEETVRQARKHVLDKCKVGMQWLDTADTNAAEEVCKSYNTVGVMCREHYVDTSVVVDVWGDSILACWGKVRNYVCDRRSDNERHFEAYEWLVGEMDRRRRVN